MWRRYPQKRNKEALFFTTCKRFCLRPLRGKLAGSFSGPENEPGTGRRSEYPRNRRTSAQFRDINHTRSPILNPGRLISKALTYIEPTLGSREDEYRLFFLETDKKRFSQAVALGSLLVLAFIFSDYLFFGESPQFWALLAFRLFFVGVAITFIFFSDRLKTPEQLDWAAFAAAFLGAILLLYISSTRPVSHTVLSVEPLIAISCYLLCPGNLIFRAFPAFVITIGNMWVYLNFRASWEFQKLILILATHVAVNVLGIFVSVLLSNARRRQFLSQVTVEEAREELEAANKSLESEIMERKRAESNTSAERRKIQGIG